jgi:hypothetical protein
MSSPDHLNDVESSRTDKINLLSTKAPVKPTTASLLSNDIVQDIADLNNQYKEKEHALDTRQKSLTEMKHRLEILTKNVQETETLVFADQIDLASIMGTTMLMEMELVTQLNTVWCAIFLHFRRKVRPNRLQLQSHLRPWRAM